MTVTDHIKIIDNKIKANQAQHNLDSLTAKISALSSRELRKYYYLTGDDLRYRPSALEQTRFDYSPLGKVFNKRLDDKDDKKEGLQKRLKTLKKIKAPITITITKKLNDESELSSERDDEIERSVYSPDVANMEGIDSLGSKDEKQTFYSKDDLGTFFQFFPDIFDSYFKEFFENNEAEKKILTTSYFQENLQHCLKRLFAEAS